MANKNTEYTPRKRSLFVKVMAWVLSILMAGSVATLVISFIVEALTK